LRIHESAKEGGKGEGTFSRGRGKREVEGGAQSARLTLSVVPRDFPLIREASRRGRKKERGKRKEKASEEEKREDA